MQSSDTFTLFNCVRCGSVLSVCSLLLFVALLSFCTASMEMGRMDVPIEDNLRQEIAQTVG